MSRQNFKACDYPPNWVNWAPEWDRKILKSQQEVLLLWALTVNTSQCKIYTTHTQRETEWLPKTTGITSSLCKGFIAQLGWWGTSASFLNASWQLAWCLREFLKIFLNLWHPFLPWASWIKHLSTQQLWQKGKAKFHPSTSRAELPSDCRSFNNSASLWRHW